MQVHIVLAREAYGASEAIRAYEDQEEAVSFCALCTAHTNKINAIYRRRAELDKQPFAHLTPDEEPEVEKLAESHPAGISASDHYEVTSLELIQRPKGQFTSKQKP